MHTPLIARWIDGVIYWNLPIVVFAALSVAVPVYALAPWPLVSPARR